MIDTFTIRCNILHLAFSGKLTDQIKEEGTAKDILDLIEYKVYFYDSQAKDSNASVFDIDLKQLNAELIKLEQRVNDIDQLL